MADFEQAIERTLQWEGGYSVNPHDPGGETLFGISRKRHPEWSGWQRVDELKKHFGSSDLAGVLNADGGLRENAKAFYEEEFWDYDELESQAVANKVFDLGVNMGKQLSVKMLQQGCGVPVDGIFGPATCAAANASNSAQLVEKLRTSAVAHYKVLISENPDLQRFWNGWYRRAES